MGFFESLPDIDYVKNYDETEDEPIHFVGKVPIVLLNNIQGIATGFRCFIPGHRLADIVKSQVNYLKTKKPLPLKPWYKDFNGEVKMAETEAGNTTMSTTFAFKWEGDILYLTDSPMNWNREKVISLLDDILERKDSWLKEYVDYSSQTFRIELQYKKGEKPSQKEIMALFNKEDIQTLAMNVITYDGKLKNFKPEEIIKRFCDFRKTHLIRRFKRLSGLEEEKIERNSELIRFIKEKWNEKVIGIKSKKDFEDKLKASKFKYFEWLSTIPVYRMTIEEVKKCEEAIVEAKTTLARYQGLVKEDKKLTEFMITELVELQNKWDKV